MRHWKTSVIFSVISLLLLIPFKTSFGCGYYEDDGYYGYRMLDEGILEQETDFAPYILAFGESVKSDLEARTDQRTENLKEWQISSCYHANLKDIEEVVYRTSIEDMELLRRASKKRGSLPYSLSGNEFAQGMATSKCTETIDYLIFAKQCEPFATAGSEWSDEPRNNEGISSLISTGKESLLRTDNHYLRLRYTYQLVRLAHYDDRYQEALDIYDWAEPKVDVTDSVINWWLLGHKAGCLKRLGRRVEASYLFSTIFKNCMGKRDQVYRSFEIQTDEEWEECLKMCKSDEERVTLYTMRAMVPDSHVVEEMEKIYAFRPFDKDLSYLLVEEISRLEEIFLGTDFRILKKPSSDYPNKIAKNRLLKLLRFVSSAIEEKHVPDEGLWAISEGYLQYLSGDFYAAKRTYEAAAPKVKGNKKLESQLEMFELALQIHSYDKLNQKIENELAEIIKSNPYFESNSTFPEFMFDHLSNVYDDMDEHGKSYLCVHSINSLRDNPDPKVINDLLALAEKKELNDFELYLLENKVGAEYTSVLYELKGTYHLTRGELSDAKLALSKVKPSILDQTQVNPFEERLLDCVHCPSTDTLIFNKLQLTDELLDFEYKAKTDMDNSAKYYYYLGIAYYNMTYFGHAYKAFDYFRGSTSWFNMPDGEVMTYWGADNGNREYFDTSKSLFYFEKAREMTTDDELAAKAAFMSAKCELTAFYRSDAAKSMSDYYAGRIPKIPSEYTTYYDILKTKYKDTEFYQTAIEECKYFEFYATK